MTDTERPTIEELQEALEMAFRAIDDHNSRMGRYGDLITEFQCMVREGSAVTSLSDARALLSRARTRAEGVYVQRHDFVGFVARWAKDDKLSFEERVGIIANHPYVRALDGKSSTPPAGEAVERVARFAEELRKWWSFDNRQMHTHSWHSREDFIERKLPSLLAAMSSPDERAIAEEREACAQVCEAVARHEINDPQAQCAEDVCAAAIRARGPATEKE